MFKVHITFKEDVAQLKANQEALKINVMTLMTNVADIEKKLNDGANLNKSTDINKAMFEQISDGYKDAIEEIVIKINNLEKENEQHTTKVCRYRNKGFCRRNSECKFYHAESECESFSEDGICVTKNCYKRHPKTCKYWKQGYCRRGQSCAFSRKEISNQKGETDYNENILGDADKNTLNDENQEAAEDISPNVCITCCKFNGNKVLNCSFCEENDSCDNEVDNPEESDNENVESKENLSDKIHAAEETALVDRSLCVKTVKIKQVVTDV